MSATATQPSITKEQIDAAIKGAVDAALPSAVESGLQSTIGMTSAELRQYAAHLRDLQVAEKRQAHAEAASLAETGMAKAYREKHAATIKADPLQGAGLQGARFLRAAGAAMLERCAPEDIAKRWGDDWLAEQFEHTRSADFRKALGSEVGADGGFLIPPDFMAELVPLLRAQSVVLSMGARLITMRSNRMPIPVQLTSSTSRAVSENQEANASQPSFGQVFLDLRKKITVVAVSNEWLSEASAEFDRIIRDDMVIQQALDFDAEAIRGTGAGESMRGLRYLAPSGNISARTMAGSTPTLAEITGDLLAMIEDLEGANVLMARPGWLMPSRTKNNLSARRDGNGNRVWADEIRAGQLEGYNFGKTNQIPRNLGGGAASEHYLVDFNDIFVGQRAGSSIKAFDGATYRDAAGNLVSGLSADQTVLRLVGHMGIQTRHPESISIRTGIDW